MDVVVDVVLTEAVISCAFGTESEFEFRMVDVCPAADSAFMRIKIALLIFADALGFLFEADRVGCKLLSSDKAPDPFKQLEHSVPHIIPAEDQEVQHRDDRKKVEREARCYKAVDEQRGIQQSKPFDLDRDYEEQQDLHIREHRSEREEHRKEDELRIDLIPDARDEEKDESVEDGENDSAEEIYGESACSPFGFKDIAYHVIEIKGDDSKEAGTDWNEHERDQSPDLSVEYQIRIKNQVVQYPRLDELQYPYDRICYNDIAHEVFYPEVRVSVAENIYLLFHNIDNIR